MIKLTSRTLIPPVSLGILVGEGATLTPQSCKLRNKVGIFWLQQQKALTTIGFT